MPGLEATNSSPVVGKKLSTLNVASLTSPPTSCGAAGLVCSNVILPVGSPTTCDWGWIRQAPKPKVKMTGLGNVMPAPTRTAWVWVNQGNGWSLFSVVE